MKKQERGTGWQITEPPGGLIAGFIVITAIVSRNDHLDNRYNHRPAVNWLLMAPYKRSMSANRQIHVATDLLLCSRSLHALPVEKLSCALVGGYERVCRLLLAATATQ